MTTITAEFPRGFLAVDPSTNQLVKSASGGQVFLPSDTSYTSPLTVTDFVTGNALASISSDTSGWVHGIKVTADVDSVDDLTLVVRFGDIATVGVESPQIAVAYLQPLVNQAVSAAQAAQSAAETARDSANTSAQAAQAAAATANKPANDAIDDHLGGDATGLVPRVTALEAGGGSGVGVGGVAMIEQNGQLPIAWDSNMQPTYGSGTPMRPTDSRTVQVPWLLTTLGPSDVPIIDSGTAGFMRGVDIMQVAQS